MKEEWLTKIMQAFGETLHEHRTLSALFSPV